MTGSGGWSYFSATRYMLGIRPDFETLNINPCIPSDWKEFSVTRKWRGATYNIKVLNPDSVMKGVKTIKLNGEEVDAINVQRKGSINEVEVVLG